MSIQNYGTVASRNLIRAAQGMLEHAQPITVLGDFGTQREMPQNSTDTLVFRRTLPFGASTTGTTIENSSRYVGTPDITASNFVLAEGVTPNANTISFQDVSVQLQQYGVLFKYSSKVEQLYEDDIPGEMVKLTGETLAEVMEMVRYGVLKAGSTVIYTNGSSRSAVNTAISLNSIRKAARTLESNRSRRVTSRLADAMATAAVGRDGQGGAWGDLLSFVGSVVGGGISVDTTGMSTNNTGGSLPTRGGMATGTNYVPRDMLALVHRGEAIVPARYKHGAGGGGRTEVHYHVPAGQSPAAYAAALEEINRRLEAKLAADLARPGRTMNSAMLAGA